MNGTYVTDITHYLDDNGEIVADMPKAARQLASFLTLVIDAATEAPSSEPTDTSIRCRMESCEGKIIALIDVAKEEIDWSCPRCQHNGVIRNWIGTRWDRRVD